MKAIIDIFKQANYRSLFLASFASQLGTVTCTTAFTFYLLDQYGDKPYYATVTMMMYTLPSLFVFFVVGVIADHVNRQKIAVYSDCLNAGLSVFLLIAVFIKSIFVIFPLLFMITAVSKFFVPAETGMVQGILKSEEYAVAGGLNQMLASIFLLFGTALGSAFYWNFGLSGAILIDCFSFIFSGFVIHRCRFKKRVILPNEDRRPDHIKFSFIFAGFKEGLFYTMRHRLLPLLMFGTLILGIVNGGLSIMPIFLLKYKLATDSYQGAAALAGVLFGTGILIGSVAASPLVKRVKLYKLMIIGYLQASVFISCEALVTNIFMFYVFYFLTAFSIPIVNVAFYGWLPQIVDPRFMGRVQAWFDPLGNLSQSFILIVIAITFPKYIAVGTPFVWFGGCLMLVAILDLIMLPRLQGLQDRENAVGKGL